MEKREKKHTCNKQFPPFDTMFSTLYIFSSEPEYGKTAKLFAECRDYSSWRCVSIRLVNKCGSFPQLDEFDICMLVFIPRSRSYCILPPSLNWNRFEKNTFEKTWNILKYSGTIVWRPTMGTQPYGLCLQVVFNCRVFNLFPNTTNLQQTTLNNFCQKIENFNNWMKRFGC